MRAETLRRWREVQRSDEPAGLRIALLGTFTLDTFVPCLGVALAGRGTKVEIHLGPINQVVQECSDPSSSTAAFAPDVVVVWPRLEDLWGALGAPLTDPHEVYLDPLRQVVTHALEGARRMGARLVVVLPVIPQERVLGVGDAANPLGAYATATAVREHVRALCAGSSGTVVFDAEEVARTVGMSAGRDGRMAAVAGIPYSAALLEAVGVGLSRTVGLLTVAARKAVVVDADGTLWGGAVGEAGPDGLDFGPGQAAAHLDFQSYLLDLRRAGVLLTLCSKNTEADVWAAFERREMRLRREHLSAWRIGWDAKSGAIREITGELGIATDAVVFIDDNPAEIAQVRADLPEVGTVMMPADPTGWYEAIENASLLDRLPPTSDDRARTERVAHDRARRDLAQSMLPETYLKELEVWAIARTARSADLMRLGQLVLKTNQMNLNGRRFGEHELREMSSRPDRSIRVIEAGDRFGDYGTVGCYLLVRRETAADLELFLLSCRVLGRGVEQFMMADASAQTASWGLGTVKATVVPNERNEPARRFFAELGAGQEGVATPLRRVETPSHIRVREE